MRAFSAHPTTSPSVHAGLWPGFDSCWRTTDEAGNVKSLPAIFDFHFQRPAKSRDEVRKRMPCSEGTLCIHWSGDAMRSSWCLATSVNSHGSSVRATRPREPKALIHGRTIGASHAGLARQWVSHLDRRMRSALSSATVRHFMLRPLARLSLAKSTLHTSLTVRSICRGMRCEIGRFTFLRRHTVRLWVETLPRSLSCE